MDLQNLKILIGANIQNLQNGLKNAAGALRTFGAEAGRAGKDAANKFGAGFDGLNGRIAGQIKVLEATQKKYADGFGKLGDAFKSVGKDFSTYVSLPIAAGFALSAKAAIDFESAFAGVKKTLNTTGLDAQQTQAEYARLSEGIREMAKEIPAAATEIAKVAESAGQLGIKRDAILDFSRVMIDLGNSTNLSADQAATSLARLANITQLPQNQFSNLGSSIVALGNNFATTESEISELGLRLAGAGKQVNLTEADILGFSAAISSVGINAEAGGTAFSTVLKKIQVAVETGGKSLQSFAKVSGQSSAEFKKNFQTNAAQATLSFVEGLGKIKDEGGSTIGTLKELGLANIRTSDTLLRLAGAGDVTRRAVELSTQAFEENTALSKEAGQRYETTASQVQIAKNRLTDLAITVGNQLLPVIKTFSAGVGALADGLGKLSPGVVSTTITVAAFAAAIGPVVTGIGALISALGSAAVAASGFGAAIVAFTGPIGAAVAAVAALAAGIYYFTTSSDRANKAFQEQRQQTENLTTSISPLLDRYDDLKTKTELNADEQKELESIIKKVAATIPGAASRVDAYGNIIEINTKKTREAIRAEEKLLKLQARKSIGGNVDELEKRRRELANYQVEVDRFNKEGKVLTIGTSSLQFSSDPDDVKKVLDGYKERRKAFIEQNDLVNAQRKALEETAGVGIGKIISPEIQNLTKGFQGLTPATTTSTKALKDAGKVVAEDVAPTLGELKQRLKDLREELDGETPGTKEFAATKAKIANLEELIKKYEDTGKAGKKAATDIQKAFAEITSKLKGVDTQVRLGIVDSGAEESAAKIKVLEDGLKKLADLGVTPTNTKLQALNTQLLKLSQGLNVGFDQLDLKVPDLKVKPVKIPLILGEAATDSQGASNATIQSQKLLAANLAYSKSMEDISAKSLIYGKSFDGIGERIGALQQVIASFRAAGLGEMSAEIQSASDQLQAAVNFDKLSQAFDIGPVIGQKLANLTAVFDVNLDRIIQQTNAIGTASSILGEGLGNMAAGVTDGSGFLKSAFGALLAVLADYMQKKGAAIVALGLADLAVPGMQAAGLAQIAGGTALIAAAGAARAFGSAASSGQGIFRSGSKNTPGSGGSGNYRGSEAQNQNREKIEVQIKVTGKLRTEDDGRTLVGMIDNQKYRTTNYR
ncbi:phage tail tape measure protein [Hymenobacter aerilatus]|uniref:Phage tail tape measure protein n=1 Tax=Hymenobacter aerilatus TaxID=2932251 RepID=A0A8T9T1I8_9BACT|nr:phage tail tape measure protein [Hymenobacter aerilatus]UOR05869.1 phage tail tape measure protein [Hymenobacter aerilatus]